jgi:hypothetical protein
MSFNTITPSSAVLWVEAYAQEVAPTLFIGSLNVKQHAHMK